MKIVVYHRGAGCDSGCCGHVVQFLGDREGRLGFDHPYGEDPRMFAERLVREEFGTEHVRNLDWENCEIVDGTDTCWI